MGEFLKSKKIKYSAGITATFGLCAGLYATILEPDSFQIKPVTITTTHLSAPLSGIKIAVLSDLHMGAKYMDLDKLEHIVTRINQAQPDITILLGDMINGLDDLGSNYNFTPQDVSIKLAKLSSPTIAIYGNHEYPNMPRYGLSDFDHIYEAQRISMLRNEAQEIKTRLGSIWIAALDDFASGHPDYAATMKNIPDNQNVIYLTHNPLGFELLDKPVAAGIAGDTHCGQINLFGFYPAQYLRSGTKDIDKWICGTYNNLPGENIGYISGGIGTSSFPIRFGAPPTADLITLVHEPE